MRSYLTAPIITTAHARHVSAAARKLKPLLDVLSSAKSLRLDDSYR